MTLASVLMVGTMALVLAFSLVGTSFTHLSAAGRVSESQQARNLAESAISRTLETIFAQNTFGSQKIDAETVNVPGPLDGSRGVVTFSPAVASREGIPCSVHNLGTTTTAAGWSDRQLPPDSVQLIGVGVCGGSRIRLETVLYIPPFLSPSPCPGKWTAARGESSSRD